eukprot:6206628-Karenia_brevis.AAC.1
MFCQLPKLPWVRACWMRLAVVYSLKEPRRWHSGSTGVALVSYHWMSSGRLMASCSLVQLWSVRMTFWML